jgi:hypothetical protein
MFYIFDTWSKFDPSVSEEKRSKKIERNLEKRRLEQNLFLVFITIIVGTFGGYDLGSKKLVLRIKHQVMKGS